MSPDVFTSRDVFTPRFKIFYRENNLQVENVFGNCFLFGKEIVFFLVSVMPTSGQVLALVGS